MNLGATADSAPKQTRTEADSVETLVRVVMDLREAERHKNEFLALLSHELRNALAPIQTAVDFLGLNQFADPNITAAHDMIGRQVKQMTRLVEDMLDVSRISRGQLALRKKRIDLAKVIAAAVDDSRSYIEKKNHELAIFLPPAGLELEADAARLTQVFSNLLINAAKYTPAGGRIELVAHRQDGEATIAVRDNGIGISADMLPRVFEMFIRGGDSAQKAGGGLGVGLTLVQQLVEMHGGRVEAHSEGLGQGSQFMIRLPLLAPKKNGDGAPCNATPAAAATTKHCRILIVDDDRDNANSLAIMLRLRGHEVHVAFDGRSALGAMAELQPDLTFLDIGLPDLDGYEVAGRIREQSWGRSTKIIALTGWGQQADRVRALNAGFNRHLTKPAKIADIERLLAEVFANGVET